MPQLIIATFLVGLAIGAAGERMLAGTQRRARRERSQRWKKSWTQNGAGFRSSTAPQSSSSKPFDSADQLRIVMGAEFAVQPLLNKSEARLFRELDRVVLGCNPGWQVMAQVSLGEILRCKDPVAYSCINSKRIDLLLIDENCQPKHAVEYQGGGHYQGTAAARDAVKKEALRRAGIMYHEIVAGQTTPSELKRLIERLVDKPVLEHAEPAIAGPPKQFPTFGARKSRC